MYVIINRSSRLQMTRKQILDIFGGLLSWAAQIETKQPNNMSSARIAMELWWPDP